MKSSCGVASARRGHLSVAGETVQRWMRQAEFGDRMPDEFSCEMVHWIDHTYNHCHPMRGHGELTPIEFELAFAARLEEVAA